MEDYTPFNGLYFQTIFSMEEQGLRPLKISELINARLKADRAGNLESSDKLNTMIGTIDAVLYHPDGRIKVLTEPDEVMPICLRCKSVYDSYELLEGMYERAAGMEFQTQTPSYLLDGKHKLNTSLTEEEILTHPIWRLLVEDEANLLDYIALTRRKSQYLHKPLSGEARALLGKTFTQEQMEETHELEKDLLMNINLKLPIVDEYTKSCYRFGAMNLFSLGWADVNSELDALYSIWNISGHMLGKPVYPISLV